MNEEIEYAEMLEIPVSTVNVARRRQKSRRERSLQESLIEQVNERVDEELLTPAQEEEGDFTTRLIQDEPQPALSWKQRRRGALRELALDGQTPQPRPSSKGAKIAYRIEFACACALCLGIFLTNVFLPGSAINTFFRTLSSPTTQADARVFSDFTLNGVVGEYSTAAVSVSPEGVVSFTAEGCVYTPVDGEVTDVLRSESGTYVVKIAHSPTFTSVLEGVDYVYYQVGDSVKHNVPVAYSKGETEVQMTMYSEGELLSCVQLDEQNCLTWAEVTQ